MHKAAARALAETLHKNDMNLVYGGGSVGLMGEVARTLVALSGPDAVHGVIPQALVRFEQDDAGKPIDETVYGRTTVVKDMHTRKALMARLVIEGGPGGGFVALSGGFGTIEEVMEVTTWNQLGIHERPVVLFNVDGYWDGLVQWIKTAVDSGFVSAANSGIVVEALSVDGVMKCLQEYKKSEGRYQLKWDEN